VKSAGASGAAVVGVDVSDGSVDAVSPPPEHAVVPMRIATKAMAKRLVVDFMCPPRILVRL
jgi:hypothetical protein